MVQFVIIAFAIFMLVKLINRIHGKPQAEPVPAAPSEEVVLLREIRAALRKEPPPSAATRSRVPARLAASSFMEPSMRLAKLLLSACLVPALAVAGDAATDTAATLRAQALADATAWNVVESLTTEIGPRLAGSEADARAVAWAQAKFRELGYDRVWTEPVTFPRWERRGESAQVLGAHAQPLVVTALGGSPGGRVDAEIVRFDSLEALQAAPAGSLAGRIAFVDYRMQRARDGSGYGAGGAIRSRGPSEAIRKGAVAFLMRSASTSPQRVANTGITRFDEGLDPIPSAALSLPDADQLVR